MAVFRCSFSSRERAEPLFATASQVARWLLVEQPGPWSGETVPASRLGAARVSVLERLAAREGARLLLIRRPGGVTATSRRVFFATSTPGAEQLLGRLVPDDDGLADLRLPAAEPHGWSPVDGRLALVCTHGRHDPCCAIWGRPVAQALALRYPEETWECSHFGGDRFAANLLVLPEGYYFGRVPPAEAPDAVSLLAAGRLATAYLRGRSSLSAPKQAAQHLARERFGTDAAADLSPLGQERVGDGCWQVRLRSADHGEVAVTVRRVPQPDPHPLTCAAAPSHAFGWECVALSTGHG